MLHLNILSMTKVALIGGIFTPMIEDNIISKSKGCIQYAADTLQKCYIEGLSNLNCNFEIFNLPYIGSFPQLSKISYFKADDEQIYIGNNKINCHNISFSNLALYKNWSRCRQLTKALYQWCKFNQDSELVFVVYAAHTPFMKAVADVCSKFNNVRSILIVPDLPEYMGQTQSYLRKLLSCVNTRLANKLYASFDGFVFLSEQMTERISVIDKEYEIIEGIYSTSNSEATEISGKDNSTLSVTYTGTLAERYGVMNLVQAFMKLSNENARLKIIGEGDAKDKILSAADIDHRIEFLGQMPRQQALKFQRQSAVLVNPRTSEGEFTKYSFPSKTMEYLASGIPAIINRLPGIPQEYFGHSLQPKDESIDALAEIIQYALSLSEEQRTDIGKQARKFIIDNKTPMPQCKKLLSLINRIQ